MQMRAICIRNLAAVKLTSRSSLRIEVKKSHPVEYDDLPDMLIMATNLPNWNLTPRSPLSTVALKRRRLPSGRDVDAPNCCWELDDVDEKRRCEKAR